MRFAISVMATASGLCLLALAIYGQPDVYLRMAREQWDNLTLATRTADGPPSAEPDSVVQTRAEQDRAAADAKMAQLQQEVARLRAEVAAGQSDAQQAREALAAALAHPPAPVAPAPAIPVPPAINPNTQETTVVPERKEAAIRPIPDRREQSAPLTPPIRQQTREQPPRQDPDDTRSVLARLRQTPPPPPESAAAQPTVPPPPAGPSPSLRRLIAARAALASGRIDEARRLLQEAQLQLVFRPVGSAADNGASAGHAAAEVARALEALSANDAAQSRAHIDRAVDDATGGSAIGPEAAGVGVSTPAGQGSGYAPAYPPGYAPAYAR